MKNEYILQYYKIYSENNCRLECITNKTINECGCTAFYMPKIKQYPICGYTQMYCIENVTKFQTIDMCNCLPYCLEYRYSSKSYSMKFNSLLSR